MKRCAYLFAIDSEFPHSYYASSPFLVGNSGSSKAPIFPILVKCTNADEARQVLAVQDILDDIGFDNSGTYIAQAIYGSQAIWDILNDNRPFYPVYRGTPMQAIYRNYQYVVISYSTASF